MKVVVIGGTGRIGRRLVRKLDQLGATAIAAAPSRGVDALTGAGVAEALAGAEILVDVSNAPSLDGATALQYFEAAGRNLLDAGREAGIRNHIVLSIVGVDRLLDQHYFQAKKRQEELVRASGVPFTILRSTQFFEFIAAVVQDGTEGEIPISPALAQPIAAADVAETLAELALGEAAGQTLELAGPERFRLDDVATEIATAFEDGRRIVADVHARYFGAELQETSLLPGPNARIGSLRFEDWLRDCLKVQSCAEQAGPGPSVEHPGGIPTHPQAASPMLPTK
ncbi:MAG: NAD(P)H-binding protein [Sphingomonadaceae bacterium]|nr:NAD(P)H-binding protein [Sphingomonadaceae bacterium]